MANVRIIDNNVIVALRDDLEMTFTEIGKYFGISDEAARTRYHRAKSGNPKKETSPVRHATSRRGSQWTREEAVAAGFRYIRLFKRPPTTGALTNNRPQWMVSQTTVSELFGNWSNYMLELGYFCQRGKKPVKIV